jgi:hypothetical protein
LRGLHASPPLASDFITELGKYECPDWYKTFILLARQHEDEGHLPRLSVSPHPRGSWGWDPRQEVDEELYEGREEYEAPEVRFTPKI